jgi:hypothetical protein
MAFDLTPYVTNSYRLLSKPLVGTFTVGLTYEVLRVHRAYLVVKDDKGEERSINFARFDLNNR